MKLTGTKKTKLTDTTWTRITYKMDKTDGDSKDEAKGYHIDKDDRDKTDKDDGDKIDEDFPKFESLQKIGMAHFPRIYVSNASYLPLPKRNGERSVNPQQIIRSFGAGSGLVMDLKRIIQSSMYKTAWLVLLGEAHGCYIIKNIFLKT